MKNDRPNPNRAFKDAAYVQLARIGKAVASPKRFELLDLLAQGPRTVEALAKEAGATVANASQHLQILRRAGLVETERHGLFITYRLADVSVAELLRHLQRLAENRLAELERIARDFLSRHGPMETVNFRELRQRLRNDGVTLIDVRPSEEFLAGHIPGAISIPLPQLRARLVDFPKDRQVIAYCRGPYCVLAVEAVEILQASGIRAARLAESVHDWRAERGTLVGGGVRR